MQIVQKFIIIGVVSVSLLGCGKKSDSDTDLEASGSQQSKKANSELVALQLSEIEALYPKAQSTPSGLHYTVDRAGSGDKPRNGQMVTAHYHGTLLNGQVFDSSLERDRPFSFLLGAGRVIPGWDEAFLDMRKGEKRTLILPSHLAYGNRSAGSIPANSVLVFEVELLDFK